MSSLISVPQTEQAKHRLLFACPVYSSHKPCQGRRNLCRAHAHAVLEGVNCRDTNLDFTKFPFPFQIRALAVVAWLRVSIVELRLHSPALNIELSDVV